MNNLPHFLYVVMRGDKVIKTCETLEEAKRDASWMNIGLSKKEIRQGGKFIAAWYEAV